MPSTYLSYGAPEGGADRALPAVRWPWPRSWPVWLPLILFSTLSVLTVALGLDVALARCFWSDTAGWRLSHIGWADWIYRWSNLPALSIGGAAVVVALASWRVARLRPVRRPAWFLALTLLLGPGLMVNTVLKPYYGRPRPRQVREFGGNYAFRALGSPTFDSTCRSFPSGHASMGFFWLALTILFWGSRRRAAWVFLVLAVVHGGITSCVRMAQGGHWFSDVLWSAGIVYFSALALHAFLYGASVANRPVSSPKRKEAEWSIDRRRPVHLSS